MKFNPSSDPSNDLGDNLPRVTEVLEDAAHSARLNNWETNFCDDLRDRVATYGEKTRMTGKQWEAFEKIENKLYGT
jgi:hypothetical protein